MDRKKLTLPIFILVAVVFTVACCVVLRLPGPGGARAVMAALLLLLALAVVAMTAMLRRSLRVTLYSYANIGLIGGILFALVLLIFLPAHFAGTFRAEDYSVRLLYRAMLGFPRTFSYYATFVITAVCLLLAVSNIALIRHEGFCLANALSLVIAVGYIGGTVAAYFITDLLDTYVFTGDSVLLTVLDEMSALYILLILCYAECILVGSGIMGWLAAKTRPTYDRDFIIILGCSLDKRGGLLPLLKGRTNRAIRFAWDQEIATGKPLRYVPSGGQGPNEIISEASAMELYLMTRGAEDYEILPENKSRNTWENMRFSKRIIDEQQPDAKVAFATTNYHVLRSGIIARRAGLDAEGIGAKTKWYFWPNGFVREFIAILSLNYRVHIVVGIVTAVVCASVGVISAALNLV